MKAIQLMLLGAMLGLSSLKAQVLMMPRLLNDADSLDRVQYRVLYQLDFISDTTDREAVTQDFIRLDIGAQICKEYSQRVYQIDSAVQPSLEAGEFPRRAVPEDLSPLLLYKGYPTALEMTIDYRLPSSSTPVMSYVEPRPTLAWQVKPERKEILGYSCQRAEVAFGGRQWVAWFTQEIPLSEGPYKFGGLPGLILELADTAGDYRYSCVAFTNLSGREPLVRWKWHQRPTTRAELEALIRKLYANPQQALKALGDRMIFAGDPMLDLPYNPIEK